MTLNQLRHEVPHLPEWHETGMCMDIRHLAMLRHIADLGWTSALEIGVWNGCSTAALIPALINGHIEHYTACDIHFKDRFRRVIGAVNPRFVTLYEEPSNDTLARKEPHELVIVDGDHSLETVSAEVARLLELDSLRCVVAHDVNATAEGFKECEGAAYLRDAFRRAGWFSVCDQRDRRPLEQTRRGFFVAVKDIPLLHKVEYIINQFL